MRVLGISAFYHDSAAALIVDGRILAAAQEERFTRKKNDASFPQHALAYCLSAGDTTMQQVDSVVFYDKPLLKFERLLETYLALAPRGFRSFRAAIPIWIREKLFQERRLREEIRRFDRTFDPAKRLLFAEHHQSHAASAFFPSPFREAAILTMDGVGEWATTSAGVGHDNHLTLLREIHFPHSLGLLYSAFTEYLGFHVNSDEYKVMGLAPYGEPKHVQLILDHLIDLKSDGTFRIDQQYFAYCTGLRMTNARFAALFGGPVREPDEPITGRHMDVAASIQAVLEEAVLRLTRSLSAETGMPNLCLAGGVALNCAANGRILRDGKFKNVWVQPAAGDSGGALGAALAAYYLHYQQPRRCSGVRDGMGGAYLGPSFDDQRIRTDLAQSCAAYHELDDDELFLETAAAIAAGKVVGWFQGRMEFGPRALGNRSILADARSPQMQSLLNRKIKYRESFRPFAPAVLREDAADWFEIDVDSPYMLVNAQVAAHRRRHEDRDETKVTGFAKLNAARSDIPAVTHIDGSARVQTVSVEINPRFHRLLSTLRAKIGTSVVVNTSFNIRDEPIVCTPEDAYRCFMATEIDVLVLGNCVLHKHEQLRHPAGAKSDDALIPQSLLDYMRPLGNEGGSLVRVSGAFRCPETNVTFPDRDGVPSLLRDAGKGADDITARVKEFYEENPFPGYEGLEDFGALVSRGQNNSFSRALLAAIGCNKLILECGCGTGQMSHFLSLNNNHVLGIDLSLSSLKLAMRHKLRNDRSRVAFVQMNIFDLAIKEAVFDVVISTGVLHHTKDGRRALAAITRTAKRGGIIVIGIYNRYARIPSAARSKLLPVIGPKIDYVVRSRLRDKRKAEIWMRDQYFNPHETWHSLDEIIDWFRGNGLTYLNCWPALIGSSEEGLFCEAEIGSRARRLATQWSWLANNSSDGGLFVVVGRKN